MLSPKHWSETVARYNPGTVYNCPGHALRLFAAGHHLVCAHERHARDGTKAQAVICSRCEQVSFHPDDIRTGYCGNCHDWTSIPPSAVTR
jgi:hypothetical protein